MLQQQKKHLIPNKVLTECIFSLSEFSLHMWTVCTYPTPRQTGAIMTKNSVWNAPTDLLRLLWELPSNWNLSAFHKEAILAANQTIIMHNYVLFYYSQFSQNTFIHYLSEKAWCNLLLSWTRQCPATVLSLWKERNSFSLFHRVRPTQTFVFLGRLFSLLGETFLEKVFILGFPYKRQQRAKFQLMNFIIEIIDD